MVLLQAGELSSSIMGSKVACSPGQGACCLAKLYLIFVYIK